MISTVCELSWVLFLAASVCVGIRCTGSGILVFSEAWVVLQVERTVVTTVGLVLEMSWLMWTCNLSYSSRLRLLFEVQKGWPESRSSWYHLAGAGDSTVC
jgi:hypothetical protein